MSAIQGARLTNHFRASTSTAPSPTSRLEALAPGNRRVLSEGKKAVFQGESRFFVLTLALKKCDYLCTCTYS